MVCIIMGELQTGHGTAMLGVAVPYVEEIIMVSNAVNWERKGCELTYYKATIDVLSVSDWNVRDQVVWSSFLKFSYENSLKKLFAYPH